MRLSARRALAVLLWMGFVPFLLAGTCGKKSPLRPAPGLREADAVAWMRVPGAQVNAVGGNLHLARSDLSIDTRLGTLVLGVAWNSADRRWVGSLDVHYDGHTFVDATGAVHETSGLEAGDAVPGTPWVLQDATALKTKGGLVHRFGLDARLERVHWLGHAFPELRFERGPVAQGLGIVAVRQCVDASSCSDVLTLAHDASGRVVRVDDRAGRVVSYGWDSLDRLAWARDARSHEQGSPGHSYEYSGGAGGDLVAVVTAEGERAEYAFDGQGRLLTARAVGANDPTVTLAYPSLKSSLRLTRLSRPSGSEIQVRYDADRHVRRIHVGGETQLFDWSGERISRHVSADGVETLYTIQDDEVVALSVGGIAGRSFTHAPDAVDPLAPLRRPLLRVEDSLGLLRERSYGPSGLPAWERNAVGDTTSFEWSARAELAAVIDPSGRRTELYDRGEHGHAARIVAGDVDQLVAYDAVGNRMRTTSSVLGALAPGGEVERRFDAGRALDELVVSPTDRIGLPRPTASIRLERRSDGRIAAVRRPFGGDLELVYDAVGRVVERRERVGGAFHSELRGYDADGRPRFVERANGMRTEWVWDASDRVVLTSLFRDGVLEAASARQFQGGRLVALDDSTRAGSETFRYDALGRLTSVRYSGGEERELDYDARSRPFRESYREADGSLVLELEREWDAADRPTLLRRDGSAVLGFEYVDGRRTRISYGNGVVRNAAFDAETGLPVGFVATDATGLEIETTSLAMTPTAGPPGVLDVQVQTASAGALAATSTEHFTLGSETTVTSMGPRLVTDVSESPDVLHEFDALSNWQGSILGPQVVYNAERNRLDEVRDLEGELLHWFESDASGFVTERDAEHVTWDAGGRIRRIGSRAEFVWDVQGRPVEQTLHGTTERFRFGGRLRCDAAGTPLALDLDHVDLGVGGIPDRYRHFDYRGNVKLVTDENGDVETHVRYGPFGQAQVFGATPRRGFARGLVVDELTVLGHRVLDPVTGRFLAPDPVPQLENDFAYALGNPVLFWDPSGASFESVFEEVGAVGGAAGGALAGAEFGPIGVVGGAIAGHFFFKHAGRHLGRVIDRTLEVLEQHPLPETKLLPPAPSPAPPARPATSIAQEPAPSPGDVGRAKGCVGACVGPGRWHGPPKKGKGRGAASAFGTFVGFGAPGSAGTSAGCAGARFVSPPDLRSWLPLLVPLTGVLLLLAARDARGRRA